MALEQELTAEQLLQGFQRKDPRLYDFLRITLDNLKDLTVATGVDVPRTLSKKTTGGKPPTPSPTASLYQVRKRVSIRL